MNRCKILVFSSYLSSGGAEKHIVRLLNSLNAELFDITIVTPNKRGLYEKDLLNHIKVFKVGSKKAFSISPTLARVTGIFSLRKIVKKMKPDVVITVTEIHTLLYLLSTSGLSSKPKHIALVQNTVSQSYGNSNHLIKKVIFLTFPFGYKKVDTIIALSQGVARDIIELFPILKHKIKIINNIGVDNDLIKKACPIKMEVQRPVILACGRLVVQKGYPYLIEAFAQLTSKVPATLLIIGEGNLKNEILHLVAQYNLQDRVKFLGFIENPYKYMATADLFVLSSIYEGFGNVIVEAMACNVPVISTDCPHGPGEIIQHGINGWLVPIRNPEALAIAMENILMNQEISEALRINGKKRAADFDASVISRQYEELIQSTVLS